jgi:hypothetical protein
MTEAVSAPDVKPLGLLSRIIGIVTAPTATFADVVRVPRPAGVLFVVAAVIAIASVAPQFTEAGRQAALDMQVRSVQQFGVEVTPEAYARMEEGSRSVPRRLFGVAGAFIGLPIMSLLFAAIYWAAFNTILGGTATFKQVLAIVTHSQVIGALGVLVGVPIQMMSGKISMAGPFNLGALAPMLEEGSKLANYLGSISFFGLWGFVVTGIGLGVLYKRSGLYIAIAIIIAYLAIMYGVSSLFGSFMGAA